MSFVYIIAHVTDGKMAGPCKVGISMSPDGRLAGLRTGNPNQLTLAGIFEAPNRAIARELEVAFHAVMKAYRLQGEWFDLHPAKAIFMMCKNFESCIRSAFPDADDEDFSRAMDAAGVTAAMEVIGRYAPEFLKAEHVLQ